MVLLLFIFLPTGQPAQAHFLKTDGSIGAVLHIEPDDSPIAGKDTPFYIDILDRSGKFQFSHCVCTVLVKEGGREIISQPLLSSSGVLNFPQQDVYQVSIVGRPEQPGLFQPFTLLYDVRVDQGLAYAQFRGLSKTQTALLIVGILAIISSFIFLFRRSLIRTT